MNVDSVSLVNANIRVRMNPEVDKNKNEESWTKRRPELCC